MSTRAAHWEHVFETKDSGDVSWYQANPTTSRRLIAAYASDPGTPVIDVGGGDGRLVDWLLADGYRDITVMDIAEPALARVRERLGTRSGEVTWIAADVTQWTPRRRYGLWHDRAVMHFLTEPNEQHAYARALARGLAPGGYAVIAAFAPDGPTKCSGLPVQRHGPASLHAILGDAFTLCESTGESHVTPGGRPQAFGYHVFRYTP